MRKKWAIRFSVLFLLVFVLSIPLCPKFYVKQLILWRLKSFAHSVLGASFSFKDVFWDEKEFVIKGVSMEKDASKCTLDETRLTPYVSFKDWILGGDLSIKGMTLIVGKKEEEAFFPSAFFDRMGRLSFPFFTTSFHARISRGSLFFYHFTNDEPIFHRLDWEGKYFLHGAQSNGKIAVNFDPQSPLLHIEFTQDREGCLHLHSSLPLHPVAPLIGVGRMFLRSHFPTPPYDWICKQGCVEGFVDVDFQKGEMTSLKGQLHIKDLVTKNPSLKIEVKLFDLFSTLDLDFISPDCVESWEGQFMIEGGTLTGLDVDPLLFKENWELSNLSSKIVVKGGKVESSFLSATLMGMQGEMELNWDSPDQLASFSFVGNSKEIASFIPEKKRKKFLSAFPSDLFSLGAQVIRDPKGLFLDGGLIISSSEGKKESIDFGCHFGDELSLIKKAQSEESSYVAQSVGTMVGRLKSQFCLAKKKGWFTVKEVDLGRRLAPFLLGDIHLNLEGTVDINAHFDHHYLVVFYEGENIAVKSPDYRIATDRIQACSESRPAVFYLNLRTFEYLGFIPLEDFFYDQDNLNLHFERAKALVSFENGTIALQEIQTNWGRLSLEGEVRVNVRSPEDVDLFISVDKSFGPAEDARDFISHFSPSSFWKLPLKGSVESKKGEIFFSYHFSPKATLIEGRMQGHVVAEGAFDHLFKFGTLLFDTEFNFDALTKELNFNCGHGKICTEQWGCFELISHSLKFKDLSKMVSTCDLAFLKEGKEWGRLAFSSNRAGRNLEVILDQDQTHFGTLIPHLKTTITCEEKDLFFEISSENFFMVSGRLKENHLLIDRCVCGALKGGVDCLFLPEGCEISYFGLCVEDLGYFTVKGGYRKNQKRFECQISDFSLDLLSLSRLSFWKNGLQKQFEKWSVGGRIGGVGKIFCQLGENFSLESEIFAHVEELEIFGINFGDGGNLKCSFSSQHGVQVEGLKIEIGEETSLLPPMQGRLGKFDFDLKNEKLVFEGFEFLLPKEHIPWVSGILMQLFPKSLPTSFPIFLENLKKEGPLAGRVNVAISSNNQSIDLTLRDGSYIMWDKEFKLNDFSLYFDGTGMAVQTGTSLFDLPVDLKLIIHDLGVPKGMAFCFHQNETLAIDFHKSSEKVFDIDKVKGTFMGMEFNLLQDRVWADPLRIRLVGDVAIDGEKLPPIFNQWISFGKGYSISGHFSFLRKSPQDFYVSGALIGRDFDVGNVTLGSMCADFTWIPSRCELKNIEIKDWAGAFFCEEATLSKQSEDWFFHIPSARLTRFKLERVRHKKLQEIKKRKRDSLLVQSWELHHFMGKFNDQSTYKGVGSFLFSNAPRKGFVDNILQIPSDIIARIGLDLTLLVPVRGKVNYEVSGPRIYLTKCEEVYSDKKRSRFFFSKKSPSWIDFKGNLNLNVKMKQYNLLMKFVELLTMNVRGTLGKPSYHLFRHQDSCDPHAPL